MEEPEQLSQLKMVLRSLVVSSPTQMDVRRLLRDYREIEGAPLPHAAYGYRDALTFLQERCRDCFLFKGTPSNPTLILIVSNQIKHIDDFVRKQKPPSSSRIKPKRFSVSAWPENSISKSFRARSEPRESRPPPRLTPPRVTPPRETPPRVTPPRETPPRQTQPRESPQHQQMPRQTPPREPPQHQPPRQPAARSPDESEYHKQVENTDRHKNQRDEDGNYSRVVLSNFLRKRTAVCSSQQLDDECCADSDSGRVTTSSSSSARRGLLEQLQAELTLLVAERPLGVPGTDIIKLYRERFGRELDLARVGLTSVLSLVGAAPRLRTEPAPDGEWRAVLADAPAPPTAPPGFAPRPPRPHPRPPHALAPPRPQVTADDALPGIEYDADVFPADCMHFMQSIPPLGVAGLRPAQQLVVAVGEVYSPSHFWLIRVGDQYSIAMEALMDEMNEYYKKGEGCERALAPGAVQVGHYCASVYDGDWHRSIVVRALDADTVKVRHVDYGTVDRVSVEQLKPLLRRWAALPAQATRARLAGVRPGAGGRRWPPAAAAAFLQLCRDKHLAATIINTDPEEDAVEVLLADTTTEQDVWIGAELTRQGHADARPGSALGTAESYLFPRFEALESGATPNYAEIHAYLRDGIALEYVDEYRKHVPCALPPLPPAQPPAPPATPPAPPLLTRVPLLRAPPACADKAVQMSPPPSPPSLIDLSETPPHAGSCHAIPITPTSSYTNITTSCSTLVSHSTVADVSCRSKSGIKLRPVVKKFNSMSVSSSTSAPSSPATVFTFGAPAAPAPTAAASAGAEPPPPGTPPATTASTYSVPTPASPRAAPAPAPHITPASSHASPPGASPAPGGPAPPPPARAQYRPPLGFLPPAPAYPLVYHPPPVFVPVPQRFGPPPPVPGAAEARRFRTPGGGDVTLSVSECEIFRLLSHVDPHAAHWYMVDALSRAMGTRVVSAGPPAPRVSPHQQHQPLNPHAQEFRHPHPPPPHPHAHPPPGFEHRPHW